jgi:hypothetical protein
MMSNRVLNEVEPGISRTEIYDIRSGETVVRFTGKTSKGFLMGVDCLPKFETEESAISRLKKEISHYGH